ncbi:MAG TPA: hypothetical protein PKC54_04190 [Ferruginibacter sp.]|nr:hypothetical protein [Ferruginibacter sp.]
MIQRKRPTGDNLLTVSKKQEMSLSLFWYGLVVYMIFFVLAAAEAPFLTPASAQGVQAIGLLLMITGGAGLMTFKFDDGYLKNLFIINLLYSVTIIMRGAQFDKDAIKQMLFDPWFGVLPYLCSVFVLLPRNIAAYKKVFNILLIFGAAYLVFAFTFYNTLHDYDRLNLVAQGLVENLSAFLALPVGYMIISYPYHTKGKKDFFGIGKKNAFIVFMFMVTLFFAIFRARRGLIFMCATTFLCVAMVAILSTKKKMLIIVMASIMILIGGAFIASMKEHSAFNFLMERGEEDTRSGVEVWMYADMSSADWVIGKGIKGKYYCPIVDNVNDAEGLGYRDNIETGYLQIILKGGIISLALHLLMFFPAVYKGLFKSRNVLSKAAALWIFLWIIYLYPSGGIVFSMNYILVWVAVGICYSDKIRNLSDETIKTHLQ